MGNQTLGGNISIYMYIFIRRERGGDPRPGTGRYIYTYQVLINV
jgi:hypothetical protein